MDIIPPLLPSIKRNNNNNHFDQINGNVGLDNEKVARQLADNALPELSTSNPQPPPGTPIAGGPWYVQDPNYVGPIPLASPGGLSQKTLNESQYIPPDDYRYGTWEDDRSLNQRLIIANKPRTSTPPVYDTNGDPIDYAEGSYGAYTSAQHNYELALADSIAIWGSDSPMLTQPLAQVGSQAPSTGPHNEVNSSVASGNASNPGDPTPAGFVTPATGSGNGFSGAPNAFVAGAGYGELQRSRTAPPYGAGGAFGANRSPTRVTPANPPRFSSSPAVVPVATGPTNTERGNFNRINGNTDPTLRFPTATGGSVPWAPENRAVLPQAEFPAGNAMAGAMFDTPMEGVARAPLMEVGEGWFDVSASQPRTVVPMGMDYKVPMGSTIYPLGDGTISQSGHDPVGGYFVAVDHSNGVSTRMFNLQTGTYLEVGDEVTTSVPIGRAGNSAANADVSVHVEMWQNGVAIDMMPVFSAGLPPQERAAFEADGKTRSDQRILRDLGFYNGEIDGRISIELDQAMRDYIQDITTVEGVA